MPYQFNHLVNPENTESGIAEFALIAPLSWFAPNGLKKPGTGTNPGDEVVISENHEFLLNKGFIRVALAPEKNQYTAETIGDKGFTKFRNNVELFFPGSYAEVKEAVKNLKNVPLVVLVKDSNCDANLYYQIGDACLGAWLSSSFASGTSAEGNKGYTNTVTNTAKSVILYSGAITMNSPYLPASATLALTEATVSSLRATWAAVPGATSYILQRDTDPNFYNPTQVYAGALLTYVNTGLSHSKTYYYRVIAVAAGFNNGYPKATAGSTVVLNVTRLNVASTVSFTAQVRLMSTANETVKIRWSTYGPETDVILVANVEQLVSNVYAQPTTASIEIRHVPGSTLAKIEARACHIATVSGVLPAALQTLDLGNSNKITSLPALPATVTNIDLDGSDMSVAAVSSLLQALNAAGATNGTADLVMAPAAIPNAGGLSAKTALEGKGWTVLVNT